MSLNLNDILGFLQNYSSTVPMNRTAAAGYDLANRGMEGNLALGNRRLDLDSSQFNDTIALQKLNDLWKQQFAEKQFTAGQRQQDFENSLAYKNANLYTDPVYRKFLLMTNPATIQGEQQRKSALMVDSLEQLNKMQADREARIASTKTFPSSILSKWGMQNFN